MPRLPGAEALGGLPSARTGRAIATIDTSAIGRGMESFGRAVKAVGDDLQARHDQTKTFEAERKLQEFMFTERKNALDAISNIPPGAPGGFSEPYVQGYRERANAFAEQNFMGLPEENVQALNNRIFGLGQELFFDTADAERNEISRYNTDALNDVLSTLQNQIDIGGHTTLDTYRAEGERLIQQSALTPVEKAEAVDNWRQGAASTAWTAQLRDDPQGAMQALGLEPVSAAHVEGLRPEFQTAMDQFLADAPGGGVTIGSGYRTPERQQQLWDNKVAQVAEQHPDWSQDQIEEAADDWVARPGGSRHEFGLAADLQFASPEAREWAHANAARYGLNFPMGHEPWHVELVGARNIPSPGNGEPGMYAIDPRYADISYDERQRLLRQAEPIIRQRRSDYAEQMDDLAAFARAGNAIPPDAYNPQEAQSIMGPEGAAVIGQALREAEQYGQTVNSIAFAGPEELNAITSAVAAKLESPENFQENLTEANQLATIIEERNKAIAADPAGYVMQQSTVGAAYEALAAALTSDDPNMQATAGGLANAYAVASLNEQARLGVPEDMRTILSAPHRDAIVAQFNDQEEGGQNAAQLMRGLQQQWGRHWPQVFKELSEGGDLPGVALVVGTMDRPEQSVAAERLAEASVVGITELEKTVPSDVAKGAGSIDDEIFNTMQPFAATVLGLPGGDHTLGTFTEAVHLLALSYAQGGDDTGTALNKAFNDVLGSAYEFRDGYRVPRPFSSAQIAAGTDFMLSSLGTLPLDVENVSGLSPEEVRRQYVSSLQSFGEWRTSTDETGLTLYNQAGRVVTVGGKPLTATWADLNLAAGLGGGRRPTLSGESVGGAIGAGVAESLVGAPPASPARDLVEAGAEAERMAEEPAPLYTDAEQLDIITRARDLFWAGQLTEGEFRQQLEDAGISWEDRGRTR